MSNKYCSKIQETIFSLITLKNKLDEGMLGIPQNRQEAMQKMDALMQLREPMETKIAELKLEIEYKDWKRYKNGENILSYDYLFLPQWRSHPQGIAFREGDAAMIDRRKRIDLDEYLSYTKSLEQRITEKKGQFFLDGRLVYTASRPKNWRELIVPHPQGVLVVKSENIYLNGEKLLYGEGDQDSFDIHPFGVIILKKKGGFFFYDHWPVEKEKEK